MQANEKNEVAGTELLGDYLSYLEKIEPAISEESQEPKDQEELTEEETLDSVAILLAQAIITHGAEFHTQVEPGDLLESLEEIQESQEEELIELAELIKEDLVESTALTVIPQKKRLGATARDFIQTKAGRAAARWAKLGKKGKIAAGVGTAAVAGGSIAALAKRRKAKKAQNNSFDASEFLSGVELKEEYKTQLTEALETKVNEILEEREIELTEELQNYLQEEVLPALEKETESEVETKVEKEKEELVDKVDSYMTYLAEQWMETNEIAIESSIRTSIGESFMEGLKQLFEDHYVDIPDDKVDVVEELSNKVLTLEEQLENHINENVELKQQLEEGETAIQESEEDSKREEILTYMSEDLSLAQKEKFKKLSSSIKFLNEEQFYARAEQLKEEHFVEENSGVDYDADAPVETTEITPLMEKYATAIASSTRYPTQ